MRCAGRMNGERPRIPHIGQMGKKLEIVDEPPASVQPPFKPNVRMAPSPWLRAAGLVAAMMAGTLVTLILSALFFWRQGRIRFGILRSRPIHDNQNAR